VLAYQLLYALYGGIVRRQAFTASCQRSDDDDLPLGHGLLGCGAGCLWSWHR
jgi:hypothetical protein